MKFSFRGQIDTLTKLRCAYGLQHANVLFLDWGTRSQVSKGGYLIHFFVAGCGIDINLVIIDKWIC